jgi:UDP-N-acetylmuramate dehydrogenase
MKNLYQTLQTNFPNLEFKQEYPLAPHTTVKIGGPAEVFCDVKNSDDFVSLVTFAIKEDIPLTILGLGSNTLISDAGIRGLVIKNSAREIKVLENQTAKTSEDNDEKSSNPEKIAPRFHSDKDKGSFKYEFTDLDYDESDKPTVSVEIDAGTPLPFAINILLNQGVTGLQWYSRIPSTIGGGIYNNIHGGTHFISETIESVKVIDEQGNVKIIENKDLKAGYDTSRFHNTNEVIVSAKFRLFRGDVEKAKHVNQEWAIRKAVQPSNSLGCIFQNITNEQKEKLGYPTTSVGYIVEHVINKKGFQIGDAKISEKHAAFIENIGKATAKDYLETIKTIIRETKEKTGITLKPEIFFLGFEDQELEGLTP